MGVSIRISDYIYDLPEKRIAKYPLPDRDSSKLLVYDQGKISQRIFRELPELLEQETLLVFNNTRVVQSRMKFKKQTGAGIEIFCLEPHDPADYNLAFQTGSGSTWKCLVGNAGKWKDKALRMHLQIKGSDLILSALKIGRDKDAFLIRFEWEPAEVAFGDILEIGGHTPIPPYLKRDAEEGDKSTYQTVYSRLDGSVAAPTAGLHFTDGLLAEISARQIQKTELTLHVGAGTFQPVIADEIDDHPMHAEHFYINRGSIETLLNHRGNIMAVGTTSTRVLESIYWLGARPGVQPGCRSGIQPGNRSGDRPDVEESWDRSPFFLDQWDAYGMQHTDKKSSLENLLSYMDKHNLESLEGSTRLMIAPGYSFRMVDRLLTNYHQPGSTLLLLVAAFIGEDWRKVYDYALNNEFRFLSYGDSSLLIPSK